jgi:hypothetical protein
MTHHDTSTGEDGALLNDNDRYELRLYVAGQSAKSLAAFAN